MGQEIASHHFQPQDFQRFQQALRQETLDLIAAIPGMSRGGFTAGLELETCLINAQAGPDAINQAYLQRLNHPQVVPELAQFNVEMNVTPQPLTGLGLRQLHQELQTTWDHCQKVAQELGSRLIMIGILPTLEKQALTLEHISPLQRYFALNEQLLNLRGGIPIQLDICGQEHFCTTHPDVMLEAATTSFQIHLQVPPEQMVPVYNAALMISGIMVAVTANSPYFCGYDLWQETRIPVFEQSIDGVRIPTSHYQPRVTFGHGYLQESVGEYFLRNQQLYPVILPVDLSQSRDPYPHVRLHNGTIWQWNRPLVGVNAAGDPHLRLEHRPLPAGPTVADMMANAALFYGLVVKLAEEPERLIGFEQARQNFYRAAQQGIPTRIEWLDNKSLPVDQLLLRELLPLAEAGLGRLGIDPQDRRTYLGIMAERVASGQTGAVWQRRFVAEHGRDRRRLTEVYWRWQETGAPVHTWGMEPPC
ncbi:MAG: glutamate-cysteine ligase family protein [Thermostichales cyanobacterium BF4_bins_65]